ncbi:hypothetical protein JAAARDRAFT_658142 [Jaapia argillacea MUCL 33604]|uniref:Uncharacterized protein n=1 Tax=Jaapia argillacea MUCL 33604 TaxID=933084 RepID=A0A067Q9L3_9AGAM|nr:hypothetical protein JAAARDRAFT_658142 [Jaapia argillacea MUCL 33604]
MSVMTIRIPVVSVQYSRSVTSCHQCHSDANTKSQEGNARAQNSSTLQTSSFFTIRAMISFASPVTRGRWATPACRKLSLKSLASLMSFGIRGAVSLCTFPVSTYCSLAFVFVF